ncbi:hypothetical protein AB0F49_00170 [Micromonospora ureilytica]|uniref:glycosyltransferase family 2 protein n=1 Tax=Micromonospora ureilytica TaxID=709868 RepID=UPI00340906A5
MTEPRIVRHVRRQMSRGFQPLSTWDREARLVPEDAADRAAPLRDDEGTRVAFVLPTHLRRASGTADLDAWFEGLLVQLAEARTAYPDVAIAVIVGMQWLSADEEPTAVRRLRELSARAEAHPEVHFLGLSLQGPMKVRTLNAGIRLADEWGLTAVGWLDDDVELEPGCLRNLLGAFLAGGCRGAVGATKLPHTYRYLTSRLLHQAKAITETATNYPHGCCILVARGVVTGGIPDRYVCDDGYVCFRLLAPEADDPLHLLRLVPEARCHYYVAGPAGQTSRRIRRILLNASVYLADWSYPVSRHYFRRILFDGMWPLTNWDARKGHRHAAAKASIKWIYFGWFVRTAGELYLRGLLHRPLRQIDWAEYGPVVGPGLDQPDPAHPSPVSEARR